MSYMPNSAEFALPEGIALQSIVPEGVGFGGTRELSAVEIDQVNGAMSDTATAALLIGAGVVIGIGLGGGAVVGGMLLWAALAAD